MAPQVKNVGNHCFRLLNIPYPYLPCHGLHLSLWQHFSNSRLQHFLGLKKLKHSANQLNIFKLALEANVRVDIVNKPNLNSADDELLSNPVAGSLRSLLSSKLKKEAFYFVRSKQKDTLNGHFKNADVSCTSDLDLTSETNKSSGTVSDDCSMIGSPLKLQTIADLSVKTSCSSTPVFSDLNKLKSMASPIPLCDARKLLVKFNKANFQGSVNLIIFCDGNDNDKTIFLGTQVKTDTDGRIVTTFRVTANTARLSDLDQYSETRGQGYQLTAQYKVMDKIDDLGSIILEARWSDRCGKMKLTKLQSAEFILHIDIVTGSDQSPVFNHYCQLQKVKLLMDGLRSGELSKVLSQKTQKSVTQLQAWFTEMKDRETAGKMKLPCKDNSTSIAGMLCGTARQLNLESSVEADFTDMLWHFVRNCTDVNDLRQCFNVTFCHLRKGNKVFVHKDNETTIAKLVRQSYYGMASFPSLNSHLSLRLAIEIGLEKIRREYYTIFINNNLCTSRQWDSFFQTLTPAQEESTDMEEISLHSLESLLNILNKLHHCLDVISVVDSFTENQDLQSITKYAMDYCKTEQLATFHLLTVAVTALQASPMIKKHSLSSIKRESVDAQTGVCTVTSLMTELPDELALPSVTSLIESGNISCLEDSREFYVFTCQEQALHLDAVKPAF